MQEPHQFQLMQFSPVVVAMQQWRVRSRQQRRMLCLIKRSQKEDTLLLLTMAPRMSVGPRLALRWYLVKSAQSSLRSPRAASQTAAFPADLAMMKIGLSMLRPAIQLQAAFRR